MQQPLVDGQQQPQMYPPAAPMQGQPQMQQPQMYQQVPQQQMQYQQPGMVQQPQIMVQQQQPMTLREEAYCGPISIIIGIIFFPIGVTAVFCPCDKRMVQGYWAKSFLLVLEIIPI